MKYIYIFTQIDSSNDYGIGTYCKSLEKIFSNENFYKVVYIDLYSKSTLITIDKNNIKIPEPRIFDRVITDVEERYFYSVSLMLRSIIEDMDSVYFFINHLSYCKIVEFMRSTYRKSKFILVLHYLSWIWELKGNTLLYKNIVLNPDSYLQKYSHILNLYNKDMEYFRTVDIIVTLSADTFSLFEDIYKLKDQKILMIPNGINAINFSLSISDRSKIRNDMCIKDDDCILLYVGRFDELKGIDKLIISFKKVLSKRRNCKLIIVGNGDFSYLLSLCEGYNCNIIFTGKIDYKYLNLLYQISDIGIIPSYSEECSYVALEMMMNKMQIISSDGRGLRNMFQNDKNVIIAKIIDYQNDLHYLRNLEDCIIRILDLYSLKKRIPDKCNIDFSLNYTFDNMKEQYETMIRNL